PVITLLVVGGFVVCAFRARRDLAARALLGVWTLSLLLFFGRATWGSLVDVLPGNGDLQMHRFIMGVHLAGIFMAGLGLYTLARLAGYWINAFIHADWWKPSFAWAALAIAAVAVLAPAWTERASNETNGARLIAIQQKAETSDGKDLAFLIDEA